MDNCCKAAEWIGTLRDKYKRVWESTPDTFPRWQDTYDVLTQKEMDIRMNTFADKMILLVRGFSGKGGEEAVQWGTALKKLIFECGTGIIGLEAASMKLLLDEGFCDVTSEFILQARKFDPGLKMDDICQALRNEWIMNCIQKLSDRAIEMTPSVLSYSLLYPYTDNYLDANTVSSGKKRLINQRFESRLAGERLTAETSYESKLFRLVELIEGQYDRKLYPQVYLSLLGIQSAQTRSLLQQRRNGAEYHPDIMDISIEKGGSSVLADACLVNGSLAPDEASFMFGFGVLLQLLDDLQDAAADRSSGHTTLFSRQCAGRSPESLTNRLINFTTGILEEDTCFMTPGALTIKKMIKRSILFLLFGAVACNHKMYDGSYLKRLEACSPLSFDYQKSLYKRAGREYGKLKIKFAVSPLEIPMAKAFAAGIL